MNQLGFVNISIYEKIVEVKVKLDYILNRFTNDDFEYFDAYAFIYNGQIKFVPIELKNKILELFSLLDELEKIRDKNTARTK